MEAADILSYILIAFLVWIMVMGTVFVIIIIKVIKQIQLHTKQVMMTVENFKQIPFLSSPAILATLSFLIKTFIKR